MFSFLCGWLMECVLSFMIHTVDNSVSLWEFSYCLNTPYDKFCSLEFTLLILDIVSFHALELLQHSLMVILLWSKLNKSAKHNSHTCLNAITSFLSSLRNKSCICNDSHGSSYTSLVDMSTYLWASFTLILITSVIWSIVFWNQSNMSFLLMA